MREASKKIRVPRVAEHYNERQRDVKRRQAKAKNRASDRSDGPLFPAFFNVRDRRCVVAGAGRVAQRKIMRLIECGAHVVTVGPAATPRIAGLARQGRIVWRQRPWSARYLAGACLAFAATNDPDLNRTVAAQCRKRGIPVNVADAPGACDFMVPACFRRGGISIAVSTGGAGPAYAARLCRLFQEALNDEHAALLDRLGRVRRRLRCLVPDEDRRRKILKDLSDAALPALVQTPARRSGR